MAPSAEGRARRGTISVLESVALEVASFGFGITIIEPGGARVAKLVSAYGTFIQ